MNCCSYLRAWEEAYLKRESLMKLELEILKYERVFHETEDSLGVPSLENILQTILVAS